MKIYELNDKYKCIFCVMLAEKAKKYLKNENTYMLIVNALERCWDWIEFGRDSGDDFYDLIDNEENGLTLFQENEEEEQKIYAWNCIIYVVAYIAKSAYEKEGQKYFPEPIELVDERTIEEVKRYLLLCDKSEEEYILEVYTKCLNKKKVSEMKKELI